MSRNKKIIVTALLLALLIILSRFLSIKTPLLKISFGFIPTILCAIWLGPKWTIALNVLGDVIGALLFPIGPYFIGYTISTALAGLIYGLFLYAPKEKEYSNRAFYIRLFLAILLVTIVVNAGLNTVWTSITSGKAFWVLMGSRIIKEVIMVPIKFVVIAFLAKALKKPMEMYWEAEND